MPENLYVFLVFFVGSYVLAPFILELVYLLVDWYREFRSKRRKLSPGIEGAINAVQIFKTPIDVSGVKGANKI